MYHFRSDGCAAVHSEYLWCGDSLISTTEIYGGSVNLFCRTLRRLGIECIHVSANTTDAEIHRAFRPNTKAIFGETIANPP